jgi:hypothetical protein
MSTLARRGRRVEAKTLANFSGVAIAVAVVVCRSVPKDTRMELPSFRQPGLGVDKQVFSGTRRARAEQIARLGRESPLSYF